MLTNPIVWFGLLILVIALMVTYFSNKDHDANTPAYARQFGLAANVLGAVFVLFFLAMMMYYFDNNASAGAGKAIWDTSVQVLPPIITLVLGFYFGRGEATGETRQRRQQTRRNARQARRR